MKLIYLFLFSLVCLTTAKYLPDERFNSGSLQWRNKRSTSDEPNISSESDDNDESDDSESELRKEEQKFLQRLEKEKSKQEKEWRKHEAKIEEEKIKYQERLEKEQRKHLEKIEKEKRKQEESQKKFQEKLAKAEKKKEENSKKELEKLEKEALKNEKQASTTWAEGGEVNTVDLEDLWKQYVYEKYGINYNSTEIEKKTSLNRYIQEEIGLSANSTKSEQRQAIIKAIQTKLQSDISENSLRSYILKNLTPTDKKNLEAELRGNIEKLDNETSLINNVTLPWIKTAQQQIVEKRTLLQALLEFLSNTVSNWSTEQTTSSGSSNNAETSTATNQLSENIPQITDSAQSNPSVELASGSDASNPEVVPSESSNNGLESNDAAVAATDLNNINNPITSSDVSSSGLNDSNSPNGIIENVNSEIPSANPEKPIFSDLNNSNSSDSIVSPSVDTELSPEASGVSLADNKPADISVTGETLNIETASSGPNNETPINTVVDNVNDSTLASTGDILPNANNPAQENQNLNTESIISSTSKTTNEKATGNDILTEFNSENTNNFDFDKTTVSSQSINTDTAYETTSAADLIPSESNSNGAIDTSIPLNNDLSSSLPSNDILTPPNNTPVDDKKITGDSYSFDANANIATDSSSAFSSNGGNNISEQTLSNNKDSSSISDTNIPSGESGVITASKDGALSESELASTPLPGKDQSNTDSINNDLLNVTPSGYGSEKSPQESIVQADLSIGSQTTQESGPASDKVESATETVSWPDVVLNGTEVEKNNEILPIASVVESTKNETVIDVKEPVGNESFVDSTDSTISSTISYVAIPAETGATVIDIVPQ